MNSEVLSNDEKPIEEKFKELIELANKEYPNLTQEVESFTAHQIELKNWQDYFNLLNQPPNAITANSAT
jgi:hypothetical protein